MHPPSFRTMNFSTFRKIACKLLILREKKNVRFFARAVTDNFGVGKIDVALYN